MSKLYFCWNFLLGESFKCPNNYRVFKSKMLRNFNLQPIRPKFKKYFLDNVRHLRGKNNEIGRFSEKKNGICEESEIHVAWLCCSKTENSHFSVKPVLISSSNCDFITFFINFIIYSESIIVFYGFLMCFTIP